VKTPDKGRASGPGEVLATDRQLSYIKSLMRRRWDREGDRDALIRDVLGYACPADKLTKREASKVIDALKPGQPPPARP
jgi:hypothetical protein